MFAIHSRPTGRSASVAVNEQTERTSEATGFRRSTSPAFSGEQRASQLGHRFSGSEAPIQRVIRVGGNVATKQQLKDWKNSLGAIDEEDRALINRMRSSAMTYDYPSFAKLNHGIKKAKARQAWQDNGSGVPANQTEKRTLSPHDPLYQEIHTEIMQNHQNRPYATDALHETGALMGSWMNPNLGRFGRATGMASALLSRRTWGGANAAQRPGIAVTGIDALRNQSLINQYDVARQDIEGRLGAGNANEQSLYSGHGPAGMDYIEQHGHDPSYGQYDPRGKGHGAHGRGAYFTDRVDKAVSYSAKDQQPNEERSFFKQDVLLGNPLNYQERGRFRFRHHNEMVQGARNQPPGGAAVNRNVNQGQAAPVAENMGQYDSLIGQETTASGNGLWGTIRDRNRFDSTEYMVRNADQVLPRYRIRYRLT